jgi:hypothetical protein
MISVRLSPRPYPWQAGDPTEAKATEGGILSSKRFSKSGVLAEAVAQDSDVAVIAENIVFNI